VYRCAMSRLGEALPTMRLMRYSTSRCTNTTLPSPPRVSAATWWNRGRGGGGGVGSAT